ncbi:MAG: hypothetical protein AB9856_12410 [Cellulosilyticaceae bacterium]
MNLEQETNEWMKEESKERYNQEVYYLIKELIKNKKKQRQVEEQLLEKVTKPIHKKWIHEHIMDQYKHEKLLRDIGKQFYEGRIEEEEKEEKKPLKIQTRMSYEIEKRLEETYESIQLINNLLGTIDEFKIYKMLNSIMWEDQMYCNRLMQILHP